MLTASSNSIILSPQFIIPRTMQGWTKHTPSLTHPGHCGSGKLYDDAGEHRSSPRSLTHKEPRCPMWVPASQHLTGSSPSSLDPPPHFCLSHSLPPTNSCSFQMQNRFAFSVSLAPANQRALRVSHSPQADSQGPFPYYAYIHTVPSPGKIPKA